MKKYWIEIDDSFLSFIEVIKHTKENISFVKKSKVDIDNIDALAVNIKNAIIVTKEDIKNIDSNALTAYVKDLKTTKSLLHIIIDKAINNVEHIIDSLPKDNYDNMSKEELIDILRNKENKENKEIRG